MDTIFFSDKGLTSSSANHIANLAKEKIQALERYLDEVTLYDSTIELVSEAPKDLSKGYTLDEISEIPNILKDISDYASLIAWLREAINAKEVMFNTIETMDVNEYCKLKNIPIPVAPIPEPEYTTEEYCKSLSLKERNRYYSLEAKASVIGKYIHPNGTLSKARKKYQKYLKNPREVEGTGRDTIIRTYIPSVNNEDVENLFFDLQKQHRETQAELNSIKYKAEDECRKINLERNRKYELEYNNYLTNLKQIKLNVDIYEKEELKRISDLRIVIPESLKRVYDKL